MDPSLIYRKTPEGEISISGRSRLRKQRLRAVLILIDGETPVGKLCEQLGDKFRPQATVAQLEQLGLIEPVPVSPESADGGRGASRQVSGLPLVESTTDTAAPAPEIGPPLPPEAEFAATSSEPEAEMSFVREPEPTSATLADARDTAEMQGPAATAAPMAWEGDRADEDTWPPLDAAPVATARDRRREIPIDFVVQARPSWLRRAMLRMSARWHRRAVARTRAHETPAQTLSKRRRHGSSRPTPWWKWLGIALLGVVIAIALVLFALPWDDYRAQLEVQAGALVGQAVHIADMGFELLPYPQLVLRNITVGKQPLARIATARLTPSVRSLADLRRLAVDVAVDGLALEQRAVAAVCGATRLNAQAASRSHLRSVRIADMALMLPAGRIDGLRAEISVNPEWDRPLVTVTDSGADLRVELAPEPAGCSFTADSQKWTVPMGSGIVLIGLVARGTVDEGSMIVAQFDARGADGMLSGSGILGWGQDARLDLRLELSHLSLEKTLASLGAPTVARGELDGKLHLNARSPWLHELTRGLSGSGAIVVTRGVIDRFNVVEATRNPGKTAVYGGAFSFDRLSAQMQVSRQATSARNLSVNAGALQADGDIAIDKHGKLRGTLYASISSAAHRLRIPITVGGSLVSPELRAAVGTQPDTGASAPSHSGNPAEAAPPH